MAKFVEVGSPEEMELLTRSNYSFPVRFWWEDLPQMEALRRHVSHLNSECACRTFKLFFFKDERESAELAKVKILNLLIQDIGQVTQIEDVQYLTHRYLFDPEYVEKLLKITPRDPIINNRTKSWHLLREFHQAIEGVAVVEENEESLPALKIPPTLRTSGLG